MHALIHHSYMDGTRFPRERCHLGEVLQTGQGIHFDNEVLWRADGSSFHAEIWSYPQKRGDVVVGAVLGFSDITQHLQAEGNAAALRDELAHLSRVGMLGALTGTLAHEINQPLAAIVISAEAAVRLLETRPLPVQELREALDEIQADNHRAGEVLQHMRTLLKKNPARFDELEMNSTVNEVVKLTRSNALRRNIVVDVELSPWTRPVFGDRVQVQQVILNLLMNAFDAVENSGKSVKRVSLKTIPRKDAVVVEVEDGGVGISDEALQRIFEPFYTTKREGLGLGLSICQSIIAAHGGTLDAARNPRGGMTFSVVFPIERSEAASIGENGAANRIGLGRR